MKPGKGGVFMASRFTSVLAVVGLTVACVQERTPFKPPPDGSYRTETHQMKIGDTAASARGAAVTPEFFPGAGIQPLLGRSFTETDYRSEARPVVILSHDLWAERFASAPTVIGQEIGLDDGPITIVGVMPQGFSFPEETQLWIPRRDPAR
jgi:hypothetical protein